MKFTMLPTPWEETVAALTEAGHDYQEELSGAEFLVYHGDAPSFPDLPDSVRWVQVAYAGVDALAEAGILSASPGVRWANAAGLYADSVAEGTLGLMLGATHFHKAVTLARTWDIQGRVWRGVRFLYEDATVAIIGAGGIGRRLIELLAPFGAQIIAVNHSGREVPGADEVVRIADVWEKKVWGRADYVVTLAPLTEETRGLVNAEVLAAMKPTAILVNAGRGPLVDTEALVAALTERQIAAAALDVTDPEPLPDGHPLWGIDTCLITPHSTNVPRIMKERLGELTVANAAAFQERGELTTEVDASRGY